MKRAKQLQPLSRQHHLGLHVARHAKECLDDPQNIAEHWQALSSYMNDMRDHFSIEDNLIVAGLLAYRATQPMVASVLDNLATQHKQLHKLTSAIQVWQDTNNKLPTVDQVRDLADALYEHIRFEERELMPMVEKYLSENELDAIYDASPENIKRLDEQR